jgi:predicted MPP superfamily phosphohydrolase
MNKIQVVSDLHLEFSDLKLPGGDLLIIAGDLIEARTYLGEFHSTRLEGEPTNRFLKFFQNELAKYKQVLYILGNHEFYNGKIETITEIYPQTLPKNVKVLNRDTFEYGDYLFVGATLWTDCNKGDWFTIQNLKQNMADFSIIRYNEKRFLPEDSVELHKKDLDYIKTIVNQNKDKKIFVITHHTPSFKSCHAKYNGKMINGAFHSELSEFILDNPNIKYWAHGHTHDPFDYEIGECRVICNPRGYYPYENSMKYKPLEINNLQNG